MDNSQKGNDLQCCTALQERAKELQSIYAIDKILKMEGKSLGRDLPRNRPRHTRRMAVPRMLPGKDHFRERAFESPGFRQTSGPRAPPSWFEGKEIGSRGSLLQPRNAVSRRGAVSQGRTQAAGDDRDRLGEAIAQRESRAHEPLQDTSSHPDRKGTTGGSFSTCSRAPTSACSSTSPARCSTTSAARESAKRKNCSSTLSATQGTEARASRRQPPIRRPRQKI